MKANPTPKKRSISLQYDIVSTLSEANRLVSSQKKLRRLPHIFTRVLELPFRSDADVSVTETPEPPPVRRHHRRRGRRCPNPDNPTPPWRHEGGDQRQELSGFVPGRTGGGARSRFVAVPAPGVDVARDGERRLQ
uniref:Uncharacterized protein n=1 Tax=Vitis vinifera TaxID=29760 RepID=A5BCU3_VITVI|nr:hypothetical protein VITISV_029640 [Vitis vinifera]